MCAARQSVFNDLNLGNDHINFVFQTTSLNFILDYWKQGTAEEYCKSVKCIGLQHPTGEEWRRKELRHHRMIFLQAEQTDIFDVQ